MSDAFDRATERTRKERRQKLLENVDRMNRKAFQIHATAFVAVQTLLVVTWALVWQLGGGTAYPWFLYVLFGWGIGLAVHYIVIRNISYGGARRDGTASRCR